LIPSQEEMVVYDPMGNEGAICQAIVPRLQLIYFSLIFIFVQKPNKCQLVPKVF